MKKITDIDLNKFVLKCDNEDCDRDPEKYCCISCDFFEECCEADDTCVYLDRDDWPEECGTLHLELREVK